MAAAVRRWTGARGASIGRTWTRGGGSALLFLLVVYVALQPSAARAEFTTKSPKVRELVAKGVKILESEQDRRVGAEALVGLTLLKADVAPENSVIQKSAGGRPQGANR